MIPALGQTMLLKNVLSFEFIYPRHVPLVPTHNYASVSYNC